MQHQDLADGSPYESTRRSAIASKRNNQPLYVLSHSLPSALFGWDDLQLHNQFLKAPFHASRGLPPSPIPSSTVTTPSAPVGIISANRGFRNGCNSGLHLFVSRVQQSRRDTERKYAYCTTPLLSLVRSAVPSVVIVGLLFFVSREGPSSKGTPRSLSTHVRA